MDKQTTHLYEQWLSNATRRGVPNEEIARIQRDHGITVVDFAVLCHMSVLTDPVGKAYFLLPGEISGEDAKKAVLMTYVLNAGTDYGNADIADNPCDRSPTKDDYEETPYSSAEISRIIRRQAHNGWSYAQDVGFVHGNGARLATTPNGMLMGIGGNRLVRLFEMMGGTTWGDIFLLNIGRPDDPVSVLKKVVGSGSAPITGDPTGQTRNWLALDRLLHHEEIHAQQWASQGHARFALSYVRQAIIHRGNGKDIPIEQQAGLADGGYV